MRMPPAASEARFIRMLPGRIRIEVSGLQADTTVALRLQEAFARLPGVKKIEPCRATGRLLIVYDDKRLSVHDIYRVVLTVEGTSEGKREHDDGNTERSGAPEAASKAAISGGEPASIYGEAAATAEGATTGRATADATTVEGATSGQAIADATAADAATASAGAARASYEEDIEPVFSFSSGESSGIDWSGFGSGLSEPVAEAIRSMPARARASPDTKVPLPLAAAMGGLAILGIKRLLIGKSALAASPVPFYLSGLVSVVTGYPFIKRGVARLGQEKKINTDLILGTGALALALVRENLVVLAGLGILQFVNWQRSRYAAGGKPAELSPDIRRYGDKAGKLGLAAAAAVWAATRDPLRGIAVLLAANPRPALLPAECAWQQAEVEAKERGLSVPDGVDLSRLSRTRTILLEDASLVAPSRIHETELFTQDGEPDKLICAAASLMEKSDHPWKREVWSKAKTTCRTLRTAFRVEAEEDGLTGIVHNDRYSIGSMAYCQRRQLPWESYYLEAKRLQKKGHDVLFVLKHTNKGIVCQGLLYRQQEIAPRTRELLARFREMGIRVAPLRDGSSPEGRLLREADMDGGWLQASVGEAVERIASLHQQGEDVLLVTGEEPGELGRYLREAGVPSASFDQLEAALAAISGAVRMDSTVNRHLRITKTWNIAGSVLAALGWMAAPLANLAADALSLVFLSRSRQAASAAFGPGDSRTSAYANANASARQEAAAEAEALSWHAEPWDRIADHFRVAEQSGLSAEQVTASRDRYGLNRLEQRKPVTWLASYFGQFKEFTTLVLVGTSLLAFMTGGLFDGIAMSAVLLANAAVGTYQERKAEKVLESLNRFQPPDCTVLRDGHPERVSAEALVPGDVVVLEAGDRVPADLRIIRAWNLEANESALTGESIPAAKSEALLEADSPLAERNNMLYMGTDVCRGKALGVVVQTGMATEIGHLMSLLKKSDKEVTPLQEKVTSISKTFVKWAFVAGGIVFVTGLLRGIPPAQMISTSITLAASAIPEGLPVTITIALSAGIYRMAKKKVYVRKLSALETLGRTTVICSDKTGTLTKNEMTVKEIASVGSSWTVSGDGYDPNGAIHDAEGEAPLAGELPPELRRIVEIAVLCNNSQLRQGEGQWTYQGDPTEGALLFMAAKAGLGPDRLTDWQRCQEIPFDSNAGRMSVVCQQAGSDRECFLFTKGAVEKVVRHCSHYQQDGEVVPLTAEVRSRIASQNEKLADRALRVLGFAYRPVDAPDAGMDIGADAGAEGSQEGGEENRLIYVGMAGMIDPPKPGVERSIREARAIDVKPVMITGDHPITAIAIARQIGIYEESSQVMSGHELERLTDEQLDDRVEDIAIFARVTPEQKLRIVQSYQRKGHTVAMTGDGVNDCPAIKQANVGIAMGQTGTDVTKETADIVLQEDHFGSIVDGVKEGRAIIGNIRKALGCLLTGNLAEILVTSAAVMVGLPIPLVPIQILLMNLLTDALPAMVLAINPGSRGDRNPSSRVDIVDKPLYRTVVTRGVLLGAAALGLFAFTLASGAPVAVAQSVAFATLVSGQLIQTLNWRKEGEEQREREKEAEGSSTQAPARDWSKDRFMIGALGASWLALLAVLYVPPLARFFHTVPLGWRHWAVIVPVAASISLLSRPVLGLLAAGSEASKPEAAGMPAVHRAA